MANNMKRMVIFLRWRNFTTLLCTAPGFSTIVLNLIHDGQRLGCFPFTSGIEMFYPNVVPARLDYASRRLNSTDFKRHVRTEYVRSHHTLTTATTPSTQHIQSLDRRTVTCEFATVMLARLVHDLATRGVRLKDQDGEYIPPLARMLQTYLRL